MAVVMMMYGHTVHALLDPVYQVGTWFEVWTFQRGLTSCLFLLLSGFAFSIATMKRWQAHTRLTPDVWRRLRRFTLFIIMGYGLHFPVAHFSSLPSAGEAQWQSFLAVDVLQLIGVTLVGLELLVLASQRRGVFIGACVAIAATTIAVTPLAWAIDWTQHAPPAIAAYLSPSTGSLFPLIPWLAYVTIGAAAGGLYVEWGATELARFTNLVLLAPGVVLLLVSLGLDQLPLVPAPDPYGGMPIEVLTRTGVCLILLGLVAHASRRLAQLPHVVGAVAQESLVIYFVHLCIVYGSVWNQGLSQFYAGSLAPGATVLAVVAVVTSMVLLAWQWNGLKHHRPRLARWISVGAGASLVSWLF